MAVRASAEAKETTAGFPGILQVVESTVRQSAIIRQDEPYLITTVKRIYVDQPPTSQASTELRPAVGLNVQWSSYQESMIKADVYLTLKGDVAEPRNEWDWHWRTANWHGLFYRDNKLIFYDHDLREIGLAGYTLATQMFEVAIVAKRGRTKPSRKLRQGEFWANKHSWRLIIPIRASP